MLPTAFPLTMTSAYIALPRLFLVFPLSSLPSTIHPSIYLPCRRFYELLFYCHRHRVSVLVRNIGSFALPHLRFGILQPLVFD